MLNISPIKLLAGNHADIGRTGQGCFMNVVAYLNGESQINDNSECVCYVARPLLIWGNDFMRDDERQEMVPFLLRAMGSATDDKAEITRRLALVVAFAERQSSYAAASAATYAKSAPASAANYANYAAASAANYANYAAASAATYAKSAAASAANYAESAAKSAATYTAEYAKSAAASAANYAANYAKSAAEYAAEYAANCAAESAAKSAAKSAAASAANYAANYAKSAAKSEECRAKTKADLLALYDALLPNASEPSQQAIDRATKLRELAAAA